MKITTAWEDAGDGYFFLISAYDETTEDAWGEIPEFYSEAVKAARKRDEGNVREMVIEIPDSAVAKLFRVPTIQGHAENERNQS
jgi:hypothetical protein